ncbi:hypothetical protein ACH9EU_05495 [Kocuria sp. M1R5S2]|uniref:hypothetical protein n=1 Tax=Kocuria rhizosphaerae TaxID=3376285 RepID=UPI003792D5F4
MTAVNVFVDTVRCYDGACGAVAAPEPWFLGLLAICLAVLWQAARATTAVVSTPRVTTAGTQLLGRRYGTVLTAALFACWLLVAFGLSVPALGAVQNPFAWTAMVLLHATLLLGVPVLVLGYAIFVATALRRPGRFRPASARGRAALAAAALALPLGWRLTGAWAPGLVADPTSPAGPADALGGGLLDVPVGGLWWLADLLSSTAALAVVAAAAACYLLLPRTEDPSPAGSRSRQPAVVIASGSFRGGGGVARAARTAQTACAEPRPALGRSHERLVAAARTSVLAVGSVLAVAGGAAALAALAALLGSAPDHGPLVLLAVPAGYVVLGLTCRAR